MFEKLEWSEKRFEELAMLMSDPKTLGNPAEFNTQSKKFILYFIEHKVKI